MNANESQKIIAILRQQQSANNEANAQLQAKIDEIIAINAGLKNVNPNPPTPETTIMPVDPGTPRRPNPDRRKLP
jgi:hypothetical protein